MTSSHSSLNYFGGNARLMHGGNPTEYIQETDSLSDAEFHSTTESPVRTEPQVEAPPTSGGTHGKPAIRGAYTSCKTGNSAPYAPEARYSIDIGTKRSNAEIIANEGDRISVGSQERLLSASTKSYASHFSENDNSLFYDAESTLVSSRSEDGELHMPLATHSPLESSADAENLKGSKAPKTRSKFKRFSSGREVGSDNRWVENRFRLHGGAHRESSGNPSDTSFDAFESERIQLGNDSTFIEKESPDKNTVAEADTIQLEESRKDVAESTASHDLSGTAILENEFRAPATNYSTMESEKRFYNIDAEEVAPSLLRAKQLADDGSSRSFAPGKVIETFKYPDFGEVIHVKVPESKIYDVDNWISRLLKCEPLSGNEIEHLCSLLTQVLVKESACITVYSPVTVVGDIHGQLLDLFELFRIGGLPPDTNYLFLGDYVDRGFYSCETFCLIASLKIRFPTKVSILRGNHESREITQIYGLYDECVRKYGDSNVWRLLTDAFDYLPMAAVIDNRIFCDHGGISPQIETIDDINSLDRIGEVPQEGPIGDLLWSDPAAADETDLENGWKPSPRGAGVVFSASMTEKFLHRNNLECICRAHQLMQNGYLWQHDNKVVTVFSAPNYCYRCGNAASIMVVDEGLNKDLITFDAAPSRGLPEKVRSAPDYFL